MCMIEERTVWLAVLHDLHQHQFNLNDFFSGTCVESVSIVIKNDLGNYGIRLTICVLKSGSVCTQHSVCVYAHVFMWMWVYSVSESVLLYAAFMCVCM